MLYGYNGKILRIDLSNKSIQTVSFEEETLRKYLGGSGLGAKILYDETDSNTDPLGPDNLLIFMAGPLVGTKLPNFGRFQVITRSPLTGSFGEGNSGGSWGPKLKKAGFDGVIIKGKAETPVYIHIDNGKAEILDASHLWGKDTYETDDILKETHGKKIVTASIGPAGEKQVLVAAIINDGYEGRAAARCGLGAVMGSKNLKAISINGDMEVAVADEAGLRESVKKWVPVISENTKDFMRNYGTSCGVETVEAAGDLPIKNWSAGNFDIKHITGQHMAATVLVKPYFCAQCVIGCGRTIEIKEGKYPCVKGGGPEYETIGMLGSNCMINDLDAICHGNELCNRYGLDTIGMGSIVSFVMEAYENNVITKEMLGGIEAVWGSGDVLVKLIKKVAFREGLGDVLALGTKRAAQVIGGLAPEFSVTVRGQDFPAHDPRCADGTGLQYATSARGACHLSSFTHDFEVPGSFSGFGYHRPMKLERHSTIDKPELIKAAQDFMAVCDSLTCCKFIIFGLGENTMPVFLEWIKMTTGWDMTVEELLRCGERIFNIKRMYLVRDGQSRKDDVLPPKMRKRRGSGGSAENIPDVDGMIDMYYELRNWNEYGIPKKELIEMLEI